MRSVLGGIATGALAAAVILTVGAAAAAWIAFALAVLVLTAGAIHYVRTH